MGLLDYFNKPAAGTPFKPGFGQGLGVLAPATNPYIAPPAAPAPAPAQQQNWVNTPVTNAPAQSYNPPVTQPAPDPTPKPAPADISKMAEVDSTFMDQKSMYANALKKFIEDNDRQQRTVNDDTKTALGGIERNRTQGLTGLSEDFASRGLMNSGLYIDQQGKADAQYDKQVDSTKLNQTNSIADLNYRKSKFEAENGENGSNIQAARREAYARLAAAQNLT